MKIEINTYLVPLTQDKFAIVDEEGWDKVKFFKWTLQANKTSKYACRQVRKVGKLKKIFMHRFLTNAPKGKMVDHINGDGLDNRCSNLRIVSGSENNANRHLLLKNKSSKYKGVTWLSINKKWMAQIGCNYNHEYLGSFENEEEAAKAYNERAFELFGEIATLNIIKTDKI